MSRVPVPKLGDGPKKSSRLNYLQRAKDYCVENNFPRAYENFVNYFECLNDPEEAPSAVKSVFTRVVCKIGHVLEETDNVEELLKCYLKAINLFPHNYIILNNLGAYMFKLGEIAIARIYLERAFSYNKTYLPAEKNLMHLQWHELPRWHFKMLNDVRRNSAYERAIVSMVENGYKSVVDIGAGCGLLSLYAAKNPTAQVTAIEENKTLASMFIDYLKENEIKNVNVINSHSTDITEPIGKCNLIVTETFDVAFFGERTLESLHHAITVLGTDQNLKIIPAKARVYMAAINSDELIRKHKYIQNANLDFLNMKDLCIKTCNIESLYDAEHLTGDNMNVISEIKIIKSLNLSNLEEIHKILNSGDVTQEDLLYCHADGVVHAIAVWFDLNLTEDIMISSSPFDKNKLECWEQAIFYLDHPVTVNKGDSLPIAVSLNDCKLEITVKTEIDHACYTVSKQFISFLNDQKLIASLLAVAAKFNATTSTVVDFNIFPLVGLALAKTGSRVYHVIKRENDGFFLRELLSRNDIPLERFIIITDITPLLMDIENEQSLFLFDVVNTDGSVISNTYRNKNEIMSSIHLPKVILINVVLISSEYIEYCNRVNDNNLRGYKLGKYINEYSGYEHPNLEDFPYKQFSDPVIFTYKLDAEKEKQVTVTKTGLINALYTWYQIQFYEDIVYSTLDSNHYKKTCYFFQKWRPVSEGDKLSIQMTLDLSHIKFSLK